MSIFVSLTGGKMHDLLCHLPRLTKILYRYSKVPSFGSSDSVIRNFPDNVSEMKKLAARDFEDLLQASPLTT